MNQEDKEVVIYVVAIVLLIFVGFKFIKPEFVKFHRGIQQIKVLEPKINILKKQVKANQAKLRAIKAKKAEDTKLKRKQKQVFTISRLSDAQDNTSIILDEIFSMAKKNNIQLLEITHKDIEQKPQEVTASNETTRKVQKTLSQLNSQAEKIAADLSQKEIEYYQIKFLFSSTYAEMQAFLTDLLQTEYYVRLDSLTSGIQKGRRNIINTDLELSILLKRAN